MAFMVGKIVTRLEGARTSGTRGQVGDETVVE
jgi:hypothetical protein